MLRFYFCSGVEYNQNPWFCKASDKIVEEVKIRIFDEEKTLSQIAYELGFKYPQHISRLFKQHVGTTPNEYKKLN